MSGGAIEIITGKERRRRWSAAEKLRIVAEAEEPGACIKAVATRHDVYPSLLFYWRRQVREGRLGAGDPTGFVPVRLLASSTGDDDTARDLRRRRTQAARPALTSLCRTARVSI